MTYNAATFQVFALMLALVLTGCASLPSHVIVAPDMTVTSAIYHNNKQAKLEVIDMRTANHMIQILREGDAAIILSAQDRLEDIINQSLKQHWQKQGLNIQSTGNNVISIAIEKSLISVSQQTFKYKAQTEIVLKVTVNNGAKTLTSTFKNSGSSNGPLKADIAVLERNFNLRLTNLLQQILVNEKISSFLK